MPLKRRYELLDDACAGEDKLPVAKVVAGESGPLEQRIAGWAYSCLCSKYSGFASTFQEASKVAMTVNLAADCHDVAAPLVESVARSGVYT